MIEVKDLTKTYSKGTVSTEVLKGVSFRVEKGEFLAIMGASGSGKSTLMNILGALDRPTSGTYRLEGVDIASLDDNALSKLRNRRVGFVFQQFHLLERASALRNVSLPLVYEDDAAEDSDARAEKSLEAVGLADRKTHLPSELSGGQQQRVAIARALVTDPAIVLADEPTGNLDSQSSAEILGLFKQLHRQGRTLVMITHDRDVAGQAGRLLVLKDGRIEEAEVARSES